MEVGAINCLPLFRFSGQPSDGIYHHRIGSPLDLSYDLMESGRPACAIPMAAEGEEEPRDGYPSAFGRIAEVLFKIGRDGTEPALIDAASALAHRNSLIEAYRPGWNEPNFSGFIYASKGLAGNRVWAFGRNRGLDSWKSLPAI